MNYFDNFPDNMNNSYLDEQPDNEYYFDYTNNLTTEWPLKEYIHPDDCWVFDEQYENLTDEEEGISPIYRLAVVYYKSNDGIVIAKYFKNQPENCGFETISEYQFQMEHGKLNQLKEYCDENYLYWI
jgi:hypothetical protein